MFKNFFFLFALSISITISAQTKDEYSIGILLERNTGEVKNLIEGLKKEIIDVVGEDAVVNFSDSKVLINDFDLGVAEKNYNTLVNGDVDIILTFGNTNNRVVVKQENYPKPVILFGSVSEEMMDSFGGNKATSQIKNLTAVITTQSYKNDIETLIEITNSKKIGVLIEEGYLNNQPLNEIFNAIANEFSVELTLVPFNTLADIVKHLEEFDDYDGIYLAGGFYLTNEEIKELANVLIDKKLPSITATTIKDVKNGIMASNHDQSELNQYFRRIALTVESAVLGENLAELPVKIDMNNNLSINYTTAEKLECH